MFLVEAREVRPGRRHARNGRRTTFELSAKRRATAHVCDARRRRREAWPPPSPSSARTRFDARRRPVSALSARVGLDSEGDRASSKASSSTKPNASS
jgi:hypothetical protein